MAKNESVECVEEGGQWLKLLTHGMRFEIKEKPAVYFAQGRANTYSKQLAKKKVA